MKLMNEKLTALRRQLYREAVEGLGKDVLKGIRWLLLKNPENLDEEKNERERLEEALKLNHSLSVAYYLKDELRQFWEQETYQGRDEVSHRLVPPSRSERDSGAENHGQHPARPPQRPVGLAQLSDFDGSLGGNEQ